LDYALAAALSLPMTEFVATSRLKPVSFANEANIEAGGLIHFDIILDFCTAENRVWPAITRVSAEVHAFEKRFQRKANEFAAFHQGGVHLLELIPLPGMSTAVSQVTTTGEGFAQPANTVLRLQSSSNQHGVGSSEGNDWTFVAFVSLPLFLLFVGGFCILFFVTRKRAGLSVVHAYNTSVEQQEKDIINLLDSLRDHAHLGLSQASGEHLASEFVCITLEFSASEVHTDDELHSNILTVKSGEVVRVMAASNDWYYGQVVGDTARVGYFPQSRVAAWLTECSSDAPLPCAMTLDQDSHSVPGTPDSDDMESNPNLCMELPEGRFEFAGVPPQPGICIQDDSAASPEDDHTIPTPPLASVCETREFSPEEMQDATYSCILLSLSHGDVVEVVSSGNGWLYGQVVGRPERKGYFPESCVLSWIVRPLIEHPQNHDFAKMDGAAPGEHAAEPSCEQQQLQHSQEGELRTAMRHRKKRRERGCRANEQDGLGKKHKKSSRAHNEMCKASCADSAHASEICDTVEAGQSQDIKLRATADSSDQGDGPTEPNFEEGRYFVPTAECIT
jgi:hypothetical protein